MFHGLKRYSIEIDNYAFMFFQSLFFSESVCIVTFPMTWGIRIVLIRFEYYFRIRISENNNKRISHYINVVDLPASNLAVIDNSTTEEHFHLFRIC